jgi:glycogen debranching enzyme
VEPATTTDSITVIEHANFAVSDRSGDIQPGSYHGFFADDTRFLSRLALRLGGKRLEPLSTVTDDHGQATFYLANPRLGRIAPSSLVVMRDRAVTDRLSERIRLISYAPEAVKVRLTVTVAADFADIFEVRGWRRLARSISTEREARGVTFAYVHRGYRRTTRVCVDRDVVGRDGDLSFDATLERGVPWDVTLTVDPSREAERGPRRTPPPARLREPERVRDWLRSAPRLRTDDPRLGAAWRQAVTDIGSLLLSVEGGGFIPAAGMPWYMAIFGRDSTITSMQTMLMDHGELVDGTLRIRARASTRSARSSRGRSRTKCGTGSSPRSSTCRTAATTARSTRRRSTSSSSFALRAGRAGCARPRRDRCSRVQARRGDRCRRRWPPSCPPSAPRWAGSTRRRTRTG